jgi:molecular chaperone DnaK (HSP70)
MSRYLVGIDLGTTHTVVAYADSEAPQAPLQVFPVDQLVAPGEVAPRPLLPSMRYHPAPGELAHTDLVLPWRSDAAEDVAGETIVGALAQELGSKVPGRLVVSAKSWLSHAGVDRSAPILPWGAVPDVQRVSPLDASAGYLRHVRRAWNYHFPEDPLQIQDIVLTVPASFDEVARRLTLEAARLAGLPRVRLVEEPQAACYDWLARHADDLADALAGVHSLLVCDVGGGTTDLTLIRIERREGPPRLVRTGVGDHLMLGGDNMDLALAHIAERRLLSGGRRLSAAELSQLVQQCRKAKERLLAGDAPDTATLTLLGTGACLIEGARSTELTRDEVRELIVDGFFPRTAPDERPRRRRAGILEFGLPYAADPAVTRHLAAFLSDHSESLRAGVDALKSLQTAFPVPDAVLLNGGVFRSEALTGRLLEVLGAWRGEAPRRLHNDHPDLSVARGAVAYALARGGRGVRIGGGSARSLFLLVENEGKQAQSAVCLLPRGSVEGRELRLTDRLFSLRLGQPVSFGLVTATGERSYSSGELVEVDRDHFRALPPLARVLDAPTESEAAGREVPVQVAAMLTDVGTLEIDCVSACETAAVPERRWRMEFQLRGQRTQPAATASAKLPAGFPQAAERIDRVYGARVTGVGPKESKALQRDLEKLLGRRGTWDTHLLRELFGILWDGAKRRRRTADHERLWLNLAGFCMRPGYGFPLDDWRLHQLWSIYAQGVQYKEVARNQAEWWTLWRRVAGGLDQVQQLHILKGIEGRLHAAGGRAEKGAKTTAIDDMIRLVAGLERLPAERKARFGDLMLRLGRKPTDLPQRWWALGRLGARVPFYGSVHDVVPRHLAEAWLERLLGVDWRGLEPAAFATTQLARMSGDRERDLDAALRERVVERLRKEKAPEKWIAMVQTVTELDSREESLVFGESLPPGLRLVS